MKKSVSQVSIFLLLIVVCFMSCRERLKVDSYIKWIQDIQNPAHQLIEQEGLRISAQYKPVSMLLALQYREELTEEIYDRVYSNYDGLVHFNLSISSLSSNFSEDIFSKIEKRSEGMNYLSYGLQNDIYIQIEGEKYTCSLFHDERGNDLSKAKSFVLGFDYEGPVTELDLVIDSRSLSKEQISIKFNNLDKLPQIKL